MITSNKTGKRDIPIQAQIFLEDGLPDTGAEPPKNPEFVDLKVVDKKRKRPKKSVRKHSQWYEDFDQAQIEGEVRRLESQILERSLRLKDARKLLRYKFKFLKKHRSTTYEIS